MVFVSYSSTVRDVRCCIVGQVACETGVIARWPREGYCIDEADQCNGYHDCVDMSDEKNCDIDQQCRHEPRKPSFVCKKGTSTLVPELHMYASVYYMTTCIIVSQRDA